MKPWSRGEIETLHYMSFHEHSISEMCYELQRPRKSILRALWKIRTQQALLHPLSEVASAHNMDAERLLTGLLDPLYYVPLDDKRPPRLLVAASALLCIALVCQRMFCGLSHHSC
jgi:hypothetical protein